MSDFASLLSQLDQSAKRPATQSNSRERNEESDARKRPRKNNNELQRNSRQQRRDDDDYSRKRPRKPHDVDQLKIELAFLCIGAQKAGTSWLHEMLRQIPSLGLPTKKEVHFWDWHRRKGLGWYSRQFPKSRDETLLHGEITPCYMTLSESDVQEIHTLFPELRIVFVARNLVDRAWSALTMELRNNVQGMQAGQFQTRNNESLDSVSQNRIDMESDPNQQTDEYFMNRLEHSTHTQRSDYATGLRRWLKYFPSEQLLVVNYENIAKDPKGVIEKVLKHVGANEELAGELSTEELQKRFNVATKPRPIRPSLCNQMEAYLKPYAKVFNALLKELGYDWTLDDYE